MKRDWELQELIEEWTLVPRELERLGNKTGSTRLGYAVLLKFFQREGRFPDSRAEISKAVLRYLSPVKAAESGTGCVVQNPCYIKLSFATLRAVVASLPIPHNVVCSKLSLGMGFSRS
jgi:hypothetical protein